MRTKGEGSFFQRKSDLSWVAAVTINGEQLKRTSKDKAVAQAAWEELKELKRRQQTQPGGQLFAYFLAEYLQKTAAKNIKKSTFIRYASLAKQHIIPSLGSTLVTDITTKQLQEFYDGLAEKGLSGSSIHQIHTLIGQAMRSAIPDKLIDRDPTQGTRRISTKPKKKKILFTTEQVETFLNIVEKSSSYLKPVLYLYWEVGGRISEILKLKWDNVGSDHIQIDDAKTDAGNRIVFLSEYGIHQIEIQPHINDYVFLNSAGKRINERNWRRQWDQWLITAFGVDTEKSKYVENIKGEKKIKYKVPALHVTPHALRHMQATHLIRQGWTVADVQKRGGWESTKVLQEIYAAHSEEQRQREMVKSASMFRTKKDNLVRNEVREIKNSPTEAGEP